MEVALKPVDMPPLLRTRLPPPGAVADRHGAATLPAAPGAYLLVLRLRRAVRLDIATLPRLPLPAGWYVYAGSAHGPGGLRARIARHLKKGKATHWHIDRLTPHAAMLIGLAFPHAEECGLVSMLMDSGGFGIPLPGFGSSDCPSCDSHLLRWSGASLVE